MGRATPAVERPAIYRFPRISPDGKRIAVDVQDERSLLTRNSDRQVWVFDIARNTNLRLTMTPGANFAPLWTPDGTRIVFASNREGAANSVYSIAADGSGIPEPLTKGETGQGPLAWSRDGRTLAFYDTRGNYDIFTMRPGEAPVPFAATRFREQGAAFSPDNRWLAYSSNETGRDEVYIAPHPGPVGRIAVSTGGGRSPTWSRDGRELFYRNAGQMMAVTIEPGSTRGVGTPRMLFDGDYYLEDPQYGANQYDVSPTASGS